MTRIWATIDTDIYDGISVQAIGTSLEALKAYNEKYSLEKLSIFYKDFEDDEVVPCTWFDEGVSDWKCWEGVNPEEQTWKNIITGELDPNADDKYWKEDNFYDVWVNGFVYRYYKEGKLIKEEFND